MVCQLSLKIIMLKIGAWTVTSFEEYNSQIAINIIQKS